MAQSERLLNNPAAAGLVAAASASRHLAEVREAVAGLANRRCIVVGSAPDARLPTADAGDRTVCVNASGWVAARAGTAADVTVITGWTFWGNTEVRRASVAAIRGLNTDTLVYVEFGYPQAMARAILREVRFQYRNFIVVDPFERCAIIEAASGSPVAVGPGTSAGDRPSMGAFAIAISVWVGAAEAVLCGFSLRGGHAYLAGDTPREHATVDGRFFDSIARRHPVSTTSTELHDAFGMPLI